MPQPAPYPAALLRSTRLVSCRLSARLNAGCASAPAAVGGAPVAQACCPALRVCARTALGPVAPGALKPPTCRLLAAGPSYSLLSAREADLLAAALGGFMASSTLRRTVCQAECGAAATARRHGTAHHTTAAQPSPAQSTCSCTVREPQGASAQSGQPRAPIN
jgi:hypothetical protein